ncbi:MAG: hypothetical protein AB7S74_17665 [Hyphomicrobium sp.]
MSKTSTIVAALALVGTLGVGAGSASAHGNFHGFHRPHGLFLRVGPPVRDCSFYREMWEDTGLLRWKRRYFMCRGWW